MAVWRITAFDRDGREITRMEVDGGEVTIGRDADRQLVLPSASVSRKHAKLVLNPPQPFVVDEGSANGVLVNGVRIAGPTAIIPGVRVDIAEFRLEFEEPPMPMTEAVAPISDKPSNYDPADVLRLVATGGPFDGRIYEIPPGDLAVGRAVDNDVVLDDPSLSRRHARMRRAGVGRLEVEDLGSSNGSYVNGRKVGRGTAGPGDTVRFGDLVFRLQGATADGTRAVDTSAAGGSKTWLLVVILLVVLVGAGGAAAFFLFKKPSGPAKDSPEKREAQVAALVKSGKAKLADRNTAGAEADFDRALDLDPSNSDAKRLKALIDKEPEYEGFAKLVNSRIAAGDRASLNSGITFLLKIPEESTWREPTAKKLAAKLGDFGQAQCKARKYNDCAWALCKAFEVAPDSARPGDDVWATLQDTEKKLVKDKTYTKCKARH